MRNFKWEEQLISLGMTTLIFFISDSRKEKFPILTYTKTQFEPIFFYIFKIIPYNGEKSPDNRERELNWNLRKFLLEFRIFFTEKCGSRSIVAVSRLVDRSHANGQPYVKVRGLSWQISPFFSKGVEKHTWTIWLSSFPSLNIVVIVSIGVNTTPIKLSDRLLCYCYYLTTSFYWYLLGYYFCFLLIL